MEPSACAGSSKRGSLPWLHGMFFNRSIATINLVEASWRSCCYSRSTMKKSSNQNDRGKWIVRVNGSDSHPSCPFGRAGLLVSPSRQQIPTQERIERMRRLPPTLNSQAKRESSNYSSTTHTSLPSAHRHSLIALHNCVYRNMLPS